jgi:hypothetical protein
MVIYVNTNTYRISMFMLRYDRHPVMGVGVLKEILMARMMKEAGWIDGFGAGRGR